MTTPTVSNAMKMYLPITATNVEKSLALIPRICLTKKNIGMRLVSYVPNAGHPWLTSSLDQRRTEFIADHATTLSLQPDATDVGMSSEQE
jgi:hypothetical protein